MRATLATALLTIVLLAGCTDVPGAEAAGDNEQNQPGDATQSEQVAGS
jgi:hypothetical protein